MIGLLIAFFALSLLFSFLCSVWEAVLLSITPSYVNHKKHEGGELGRSLVRFKEDIDRPLSAILTLNTIAHTVGAIGVGAQAGKIFGTNHFNLLGLSISWESIIAGAMTLAILVFSEIIPKTIGANMWKQLAPFTVRSIKVLMVILWPLVWLSQRITRSLKKDKSMSVYSRADFTAIAQVAKESGALDYSESKIINNLLKFDEVLVRDIMTPRTVMVTANEDTFAINFYKGNKNLRFSRIPVYNTEPDQITGYVLKDDIMQRLVENEKDLPLKELKREIPIVIADTPLPILFEDLMKKREHMATVVDEHGTLVGLVTMEDVFETLLGLEIMDEQDAVADLQALARRKWEERAQKAGLIE